MNRSLQIKIIAYLIGMISLPILIICLLFINKYNSFMKNNKEKYIEIIKENSISKIKYSFEKSSDRLERLEEIFISKSSYQLEFNAGEYLTKEERISISAMPGLENVYFFNSNLDLLYKIFQNTENIESLREIIDKDIVQRLTFKNVMLHNKYFNYAILKVQRDKVFYGHIVMIFNNGFFDLDKNSGDAFIDIYDNNFNLIKTNSNKKLYSKEINDDTKSMLDGEYRTVINKSKALSYGFIDLNGDDVYVMTSLNSDRYMKSDNLKLYIVISSIFSVIIIFLLGWKLIGFINIYIDNSIENKEYDDYTLNKLKIDLEQNIKNIDNVIEDLTDFQILKQDLIKMNERFLKGSGLYEKSNKRNRNKKN